MPHSYAVLCNIRNGRHHASGRHPVVDDGFESIGLVAAGGGEGHGFER